MLWKSIFRKRHNNPKIVAEPKMFVELPTQAPTLLSNTQQILLWINSLTLPAIIIGVIKGTRWVTKKEDAFNAGVKSFKEDFVQIKDNHLHTMQETLKDMRKEQTEGFKDLVASQNAAKDAIVNAILLTKK